MIRNCTGIAQEVVLAARKNHQEWSKRLFWRHRFPGFRQVYDKVQRRIREIVVQEQRVFYTEARPQGYYTYYPISAYPGENWEERFASKEHGHLLKACYLPTNFKGKSHKRYFDVLGNPVDFDQFVLQAHSIYEMGLDFDVAVVYHPCQTEWVSDGGKRDSWETFADCHSEVVKESSWFEFRLTMLSVATL